MLTVKGHRVLVKPDPPKDQFNKFVSKELAATGFEVVLPEDQERRELVGTSVGTVVAIGGTCWRSYDGDLNGWEPWCKVGDRITFSRYAGKLVEDPVTEERFMLINDVDVQCIIEGEKAPWEN